MEIMKNIADFPRHELYKQDGRFGRYGINISTEIGLLIKEAAKCSSYASDVIYGIENINRALESGKEIIEWFGFRDYGVDHDNFINAKLNDEHMYGSMKHNYRRIIIVEVKMYNEYYDNGVMVTTSEVEF